MTLGTFVKRLERLKAKNDLSKALELFQDLPGDLLALHAIVQTDWPELMRSVDMLEISDAIDLVNDEGKSVLHVAAASSPEMLRATLLQHIDAGLFEFDDNQQTPAMVAIEAGKLENLKLLVRAGADLNQVDPEGGYCALELATHQPTPEILNYLLDAGADPTVLDMDALEEMEIASEEMLDTLRAAIELRSAMDRRRFTTIEVSMSSGEAQFVMPAALSEQSPLFISDVIGDLADGAEEARLEQGELAFGDGPNAVQAAQVLGMPSVAEHLARKKTIQSAETAKPPKGRKPH